MTRKPPNLLFILGESHAPHLLGAAGNPHIKTPNLDRLAARGTRFETAYCASPLCVPARAALATGKFPHQTGYWDSSLAYDGREASWMHRLRASGHETVGIGKMHFRSDAADNGFSRVIETMQIADGVGDLISALRYDGEEPTYRGLWRLWTSRYGAGDQDPYRQYDERIVASAVDWLANEAPRNDRPWALSVHFIAAHAPFMVPERFYRMYDPARIPPPVRYGEGERPDHPAIAHLRDIICHEADLPLAHTQKVRAAYFATVTYLDHLVGRLLEGLEQAGLQDDTQIIYTSDHGFSCGDHYIFGLFHFFEESLGVPLIMAGPGVPSGTTVSQPVSHVDLCPTILESAGLEPTGQSLWPLLNGQGESRDPVFAEYHGTGTLTGGYVLRDGAMKLVTFVGLEPQLFDLARDPEESRDLAGDPAMAPVLERMLRALRARIDPEAVDRMAKQAQEALIAQHGGKAEVLRAKQGFSYSPPPGLRWQMMDGNDAED